MTNKEWSDKLIKSCDPSFKHRWEVYEDYLRKRLNHNTIWLDLGCGNNADINEKNDLVMYAAGVDIYRSNNLLTQPLIIADITSLPFKTDSIDVISLRFVIEHISDPGNLFAELDRVLRQNGIVILITTNIWSPFIFVPKIIPYGLRKQLIKRLFKVYDEDIFPTYHRFNSYLKSKNQRSNLILTKLEFIQDLNYSNRTIFIIFFIWHLFTKIKLLRIFRTNIITNYEKLM